MLGRLRQENCQVVPNQSGLQRVRSFLARRECGGEGGREVSLPTVSIQIGEKNHVTPTNAQKILSVRDVCCLTSAARWFTDMPGPKTCVSSRDWF